MNKSQLVSTIADSASMSIVEAEKTLSAILECIQDSLVQGDSVSLIGFGTFGVKKRAARKIRNPQTGKEMMINAATVPSFKAGKGLKEQVDIKKD
jgi:DNA-binding protein HU-beta